MVFSLRVRTAVVAVVAGILAAPVVLDAQGQKSGVVSLGSVRVSRQVVANGETLPAGTYTLRVLPEAVPGAVGHTAAESHWVEFVQGGQVKGKELATVISGEEAKAVVGNVAGSGATRVEMLKGNEYLRIWARRGGTHYLVHLAVK